MSFSGTSDSRILQKYIEETICPYKQENIVWLNLIKFLPEYLNIVLFLADFLPFGRLLLWGHGLEPFAPHMLGDCFYLFVFYQIYTLGYLPRCSDSEVPRVPRWLPFPTANSGVRFPLYYLISFPGLIIANAWSIYCKYQVFRSEKKTYYPDTDSFVPTVLWTLFVTFTRCRIGLFLLKSIPTIKKSYTKFAISLPLVAAWYLFFNWVHIVNGDTHMRVCPSGVPERSLKLAAMASAFKTARHTVVKGKFWYLPVTELMRGRYATTYKDEYDFMQKIVADDSDAKEKFHKFINEENARKTEGSKLSTAYVKEFANLLISLVSDRQG